MANKKADFKLNDVEAIKRQDNVKNCWFDDKEGLFHCLMKDGTEWTSLTGRAQGEWIRIPEKRAVKPMETRVLSPDEIKLSDEYMHAHLKEVLYTDTQAKLVDVLDGMKNLLLYKNKKYGDSALKPKNIFYKGDATNSILIRLDDKIGRVMSNPDDKPRVNDVADIIGYCTLLLISMNVTSEDLKKFMD